MSASSKFIVIYNFINPEMSVVLNDLSFHNFVTINTESLVGQGVSLCKARIIKSAGDAEDRYFEVMFGDAKCIFEIYRTIKLFPLIEGELAAGLYQFYSSDGEHYEIKSALDLTDLFDREPNFDYRNEKFVCSPDGIRLHEIRSDEELCFYQKFPLSYFDVNCPFCLKKIIAYEVDPEIFSCSEITLPCSHYVGMAVSDCNQYETDELDDIGYEYKLLNGNLYFRTDKGWQKPLIYTVPIPKLSIHRGPKGDELISHFFFIDPDSGYWLN